MGGVNLHGEVPNPNSILSYRNHCAFQQIVCANLQHSNQKPRKVFSPQAFDPNANDRWSGKSSKRK